MSARTWFRLLGLGVFLITGLAGAAKEPMVELQAGGHVGRADGGWVCGPTGHVKYGGLHGAVRVHADKPEGLELPRKGPFAEIKAVSEHRSFGGECVATGCKRGDGVVVGGGALAGIDSRYGGAALGIAAVPMLTRDGTRTIAPVPEVRLRTPVFFHSRLELGFGSPSVTTVVRPGFFLAAHHGRDRFALSATTGAFAIFPALSFGGRTELGLRFRTSDSSSIGASFAVQSRRTLGGEIALQYAHRL